MNIRTRLCAAALSLTMILSLSACTQKQADDEVPEESPAVTENTGSDSLLPEDFTADTSAQDICLATTDIPGDFELFTVDGVPVTAYSYLYWLTYTISYMENALASYGMSVDWTADESLIGMVKEDAASAAARYALIESKAKALGYDMTDEQRSELESSLALTAQYVGGEEALLNELRKSGVDYDTFYQINAVSYYYTQLENGLFPDAPTDAEMDTYIEENDVLRAKHILLMTVDSSTREPLDDETIAQKKASAESILAQLRSSSDLAAEFDTLMNQYSEDPGLAYYPDGYVFTAGEMVAEFEDATRALKYGQVSDIVECDSTGYHIILRLDPDTEDLRSEYASQRMSDQITAWSDEAEIVFSEEYDAFNIPLFYERYIAYQEAFDAEDAAQAAADQADDTADTQADSAQ